MISNRFSKMLSTRLPPYIISFQWAENKNLIHKSIATSIRCTLVHILFCSIKILYCLYPLCSILHRWACCRKAAYPGFNRSQETVSLMRGDSCERTIDDNVKCSFATHTNHRPPGSSIHGNSQATILGWAAISCSKGSS